MNSLPPSKLNRAAPGPIGIFDSGFGGLTVLQELRARLPQYDYLYLGDSARVPYGNRSHERVYEFTKEAVFELFDRGCHVVVLACNTASARALRRIQQEDLPVYAPERRVLGVIRPSAEELAGLPAGAVPGLTPPALTQGTVAVLATAGTVSSNSYGLELSKLAPQLTLRQQACKLWVALVEAGETESCGARYFLEQDLQPLLDSEPRPSKILLGCTHYPLLLAELQRLIPEEIEVIPQGPLIAQRLQDWLERHPAMAQRLSRGGDTLLLTTDNLGWFAEFGERVLGTACKAEMIRLERESKSQRPR